MISNETLILFTVIIVLTLVVASTLYSQVSSATDSAETVAGTVYKKTLTEISIVSVNPTATDTNIYVSGVSGEVNLYNAVVILDGVQYTPTVTPLRDEKTLGILDPNDLYLLSVPAPFKEGSCLRIYADGITSTYGLC